MKKIVRKIILLAFVFISVAKIHPAVQGKLRKTILLQTKHFDLLFPKECEQSALFISTVCDEYFEEVCKLFHYEKAFRLPVVFSPDSDVLSVSYSASPYNRIVVYDSPAMLKAAIYSETLLVQFRKEVVRAVGSSIRSPFWHVTSKIIADAIQPVSVLNMPLSFVEGACTTLEKLDNWKQFDDARSLQILSQAKLENKFPRWQKITGARDIYPGDELAMAAGTAFASYLQSRWGIERYINFWNATGSVHLFSFTAGIFESVYNLPLKTVWKDFMEAVPLPENVDAVTEVSSKSFPLVKIKYDKIPKYLIANENYIIWFDEARNEVLQLDKNGKERMLFSATDVTRLSFSNDGNYLTISFYAQTSRLNIKTHAAKIFDLQKREFITDIIRIQDASTLVREDGSVQIIGFEKTRRDATSLLSSELVLYKINGKKSFEKVYSHAFTKNILPYLPNAVSSSTISCMVNKDGKYFLFTKNINTGKENFFALPYIVTGMERSSKGFVFSHASATPGHLQQCGIIQFDKDDTPQKILLQTTDIFGGAYYASVSDNNLLYCARYTTHGELRFISLDDFPMSEIKFDMNETGESSNNSLASNVTEEKPLQDDNAPKKKHNSDKTSEGANQNENEIGLSENVKYGKYNPFKYIFRGLWIPMLPLAEFSFEEGYKLAPGIGVTYKTETDPFEIVSGIFSFSTAMAKPETAYMTFRNEFALSAYITTALFPVDITGGVQWRFTKYGDYTLQVLTGAKWQWPLGMSYHHLFLTAQHMWTVSTKYIDPDTGFTNQKAAWVSVPNAFHDNRFLFTLSYDNYHQAGISAYEQKGFEISGTLLLDYDGEKSWKYDSPLRPTQFAFGINVGFKIPRIHPFSYINNFVLGLPLSIRSEWFGERGTSCNTIAEMLLLGWESHIGIPVLNLYLTRLGVKFGYNFFLEYDTVYFPDPDIRLIAEYFNVVKNATWNDFIYFSLEGTLSPNLGSLAKLQVTPIFQFEYHFREKKGERFKFTANIRAKL